MALDLTHILIAVLSVAATWYSQRQAAQPASPATPGPGGKPAHPLLDAVLKVIEKAEHDGAIDKLRSILSGGTTPPAPPK